MIKKSIILVVNYKNLLCINKENNYIGFWLYKSSEYELKREPHKSLILQVIQLLIERIIIKIINYSNYQLYKLLIIKVIDYIEY